MNTYVTEMAENSIHALALDSLFFDDCCGKYYSLITGMLYESCEDAENDAIELLTRNLNKITR
jgi:hypothetical protein